MKNPASRRDFGFLHTESAILGVLPSTVRKGRYDGLAVDRYLNLASNTIQEDYQQIEHQIIE